MRHLIDVADLPVVDVWGDTVRARRVDGERATLALVELDANAIVPGHRHENEQLGMVVTGSLVFTIGDESREVGPGEMWRIPSNMPHQVTVGPAGAVVVDIFSPPRTDWAALPSQPPSPPIWPERD